MFKFKPSLLVLLSLAAMAIGADDTDDKYFKEIPCPSGTKTPYYEVEVNEGFFVSLTRSDYSVSGGTEAGGKPFTFKLFDTGHEESVDMDVFWGGSPTAEKDKGIRQLIVSGVQLVIQRNDIESG